MAVLISSYNDKLRKSNGQIPDRCLQRLVGIAKAINYRCIVNLQMANAGNSSSSSSDIMYTVPAIQRPTSEQLRSVAEGLHLHISADELEEYKCIYLLLLSCS